MYRFNAFKYACELFERLAIVSYLTSFAVCLIVLLVTLTTKTGIDFGIALFIILILPIILTLLVLLVSLIPFLSFVYFTNFYKSVYPANSLDRLKKLLHFTFAIGTFTSVILFFSNLCESSVKAESRIDYK